MQMNMLIPILNGQNKRDINKPTSSLPCSHTSIQAEYAYRHFSFEPGLKKQACAALYYTKFSNYFYGEDKQAFPTNTAVITEQVTQNEDAMPKKK